MYQVISTCICNPVIVPQIEAIAEKEGVSFEEAKVSLTPDNVLSEAQHL